MNNLKLDGRTIAIGIVVVLAIIVIGSQLLGRGQDTPTPTPTPDTALETDSDIQIGDVVTASNIDRDGCPVDETSVFDPSDSVYVVALDSDIPAGTDMFARLYQDDVAVEDSPVATADQDYENTCIYFIFEASSGAEVLDTGNYEAQVIVRGNPGPSVNFEVR